jgi:hypothetical protein
VKLTVAGFKRLELFFTPRGIDIQIVGVGAHSDRQLENGRLRRIRDLSADACDLILVARKVSGADGRIGGSVEPSVGIRLDPGCELKSQLIAGLERGGVVRRRVWRLPNRRAETCPISRAKRFPGYSAGFCCSPNRMIHRSA